MRYQLQHPSYITPDPMIYVCFGLGSCIGLFIADRIIGLIGGMQIALPTSLSDGEFLSIARLIEQLLVNFRMARRNLNVLLATIDRVAQGYRSLLDIGKQNIKMVIQKVTPRRNFGIATDVYHMEWAVNVKTMANIIFERMKTVSY
jgi:chemotaxis protein CheD